MQNRTGFYPSWVALQTLSFKEMLRFMRIWSQTLLPPAITMSLYFIIFGRFIGSQIQPIHGYTYIQFIIPGLVMMSIMTNAYANTASSFFLTKFNKSIEEILVSPMPNFIILLGFVLGGTIRGMLVGIIVILISLLFTHIPLHHPIIIFTMATLAAMVFSLGGLINGIYAKRFDDISFIPTFFAIALAVFSLSPVIITVLYPALCNSNIAFCESDFTSSATAIAPRIFEFSDIIITVFPCDSSSSIF